MNEKILVVDDDEGVRYSLKRMLERANWNPVLAQNGKEALEIIKYREVDLVLMDIKMAGMTGLDVLDEINRMKKKLLVIIMTAYGTTDTAIEAMKKGAFDYILKPFELSQIGPIIEKALSINRLMKEPVYYPEDAVGPGREGIVGISSQMQEVYKMIGQVADKDITVLIRGESGTGKELIARAIYHHSLRADMPYLPVNCAAIPETLLESELFGYEKGAFTDARIRRIGRFEQCSGGTIFLDEIGDMALSTQAKILRVIEDRQITRLGSNDPIDVDVRLIVATNKNLEDAIARGTFREDLYYRLNVVTINLPPLRERGGDIPLLAHHFLKKFSQELNKEIIDLKPEAMDKLKRYYWPGNVRELENVIRRACILSKGRYILEEDIAFESSSGREEILESRIGALVDELFAVLNSLPDEKKADFFSIIERYLIRRALLETKGNKLSTARLLGMNRNTLANKIRQYGIK